MNDAAANPAGLLPGLVIAGAPKSGTSSVFRWLADHPDVLGSSVKETCYFVDPGTHVFDPKRHFLHGGLDGYSAFFPRAKRTPRLVVEATPSYLYSDLALRQLPVIPSRPHFLFLLREPARQIHSTFRYFQSNWDWIPAEMSFATFLQASESGTADFNGNELARHAVRNAAYVDFLLRWREMCGKDRIHVFLFEDAFANKRGFMRGIAVKFGIDPDFYDTYDFPAENQTYAVRSNALQRLNIGLRSWLPQGALYNAARAVYRRMNTRVDAPDQQIDPDMQAKLAARYRQANQRLAQAFNLDLGIWAAKQASPSSQRDIIEEVRHVTG
jgi:hypothetical protein